jgi:peptide/nickel transport system permease protein
MGHPMRTILAVLRRASQLLVLLFLVTSITFLLSSLIPGDFFTMTQLDPTIQPDTIKSLRHKYGLDQPVYVQYTSYLRNIVQLDLGYSLYYRTSVRSVVIAALIRTLWIGLPSLLLGASAGICLGTVRGIYQDRPIGHILDFISTVALSLPSLILGLGALMFAARTNWFPLGGMSSAQLQDPHFGEWMLDRIHHLILPVMCLGIPVFASIERIQHAAMRTCSEQLFVRSARSRGLSRGRIFFQYLLRPALNPTLSAAGPLIGGVLSGSLVLEVIFAWPGLGQVTYDALFNRDLYLLVGCVISSGALLAVGNLVADILLFVLDPRARESFGGVRL